VKRKAEETGQFGTFQKRQCLLAEGHLDFDIDLCPRYGASIFSIAKRAILRFTSTIALRTFLNLWGNFSQLVADMRRHIRPKRITANPLTASVFCILHLSINLHPQKKKGLPADDSPLRSKPA
jgi:hypothetical protein